MITEPPVKQQSTSLSAPIASIYHKSTSSDQQVLTDFAASQIMKEIPQGRQLLQKVLEHQSQYYISSSDNDRSSKEAAAFEE